MKRVKLSISSMKHARLSFGLVGILVGGLLLQACKTNEKPGNAILDGTDLNPPAEADRDDGSNIPLSLWSPAQRRSTAGYYFLAAEMIAMKERDGKKALPIYEAAYSLDPNPFLGGKTIAAKAAAGDRDQATLDAKKMVLLYPRDAKLRLLYGQLLSAANADSDAIEQLEKCVSLDPTSEDAYLELIDVYQRGQQIPKAIVVAKDLVKHVPSSLTGWSQLSRLYLTNGQYKEALIPAQRAWEMQSNNPNLTQVYAIVLQLNGKTKQAIHIYEQLYRMNPTDEELTGRMIELYRELGNLEDALSLLNEMIKEGGESKVGVQMQKAIVLWELKRFKEASDLLNKLSSEYPESDRLKYMAALGQEKLEQRDKALATYESIPDNSSFKFQADYRVAIILKDQKKFDQAIAKAKLLIESKQADWDAYGLLAGIYADQNNYDDAIATLDEGYKRFPTQPRLLFLKGAYQEKAGDRDGCIATMRQVIAKDPTNSGAYNFLGYLFAERGENLDEAERLIKKALELKPSDGFYLDSLGWVYFQKREYDKAKPTLEKALQLEPKEGVIFEHLGDLKKANGDAGAARDLYGKALKGNLEDKDRERVQKKLHELGAK